MPCRRVTKISLIDRLEIGYFKRFSNGVGVDGSQKQKGKNLLIFMILLSYLSLPIPYSEMIKKFDLLRHSVDMHSIVYFL